MRPDLCFIVAGAMNILRTRTGEGERDLVQRVADLPRRARREARRFPAAVHSSLRATTTTAVPARTGRPRPALAHFIHLGPRTASSSQPYISPGPSSQPQRSPSDRFRHPITHIGAQFPPAGPPAAYGYSASRRPPIVFPSPAHSPQLAASSGCSGAQSPYDPSDRACAPIPATFSARHRHTRSVLPSLFPPGGATRPRVRGRLHRSHRSPV